MSDYVSEAEALADIYDGSEIYDKSSTLFLGGIKHGRNILKHRYGNTPKGMYFIIQDCRNGCGSLMLVDRRKSKKFFLDARLLDSPKGSKRTGSEDCIQAEIQPRSNSKVYNI